MLIFDADDTLWENNVLFERVIADFLDWLDHPTMEKTEIRRIFDDIQRANAVTHGYGSKMFLRSLGDCFEHLYRRPAADHERNDIEKLASALVHRQVELIPGVSETLSELSERHHLVLLTKGDLEEQQRKLDASQLADHFKSVRIVAEKGVEVYREVAESSRWPLDAIWMIGNSPKSDIVPARRAGMNAIFIPNDNTWVLEHEELDMQDNRVLRLERFTQLLDHF
ncbi:HAD family hydrolase [Streptomyces sp. ME19-01-6]|uniref:HAD family hydrolase n=1 Tax=Streptomyces sp. ME19-01-6 TaxID=3028686 RepID=UPI0029AE1761|nr:HAD family hydrolase [Streptomyces sp. ME19-01-6]MDX3233165.1 HAD family hydrolase [Streptomyces sp. ME19-01-6]